MMRAMGKNFIQEVVLKLLQLVVGMLTHLFLSVCKIYVDLVVIRKVIFVCEGHNDELV